MRHTTLLLVIVLTLLLTQDHFRATSVSEPALQGTFLQLTHANAAWTLAQWEALFDRFRALSLSQIVVQWSAYDDLAFYKSQALSSVPSPPLPTVLGLADRAGMRVTVGLAHDSQYWSHIRSEPAVVEVYLRRLRVKSIAVARELTPSVRKHPSFSGWYLPQELDDASWVNRKAWHVLLNHVSSLSDSLRKLTPQVKVALSGFSNGRMDPERLAADWQQLTSTAGVDTIMFQDGVGVAKLRVEELEPYFSAFQRTFTRPGEFQIVVETFTQSARAAGDEFAAQPAPIDRIVRQIDIARRYTRAPLIAFSVPEYMTPEAGPAAARLFDVYRQRYPRE